MTRIPAHTLADAPGASRPLLEGVVRFSPAGRLLNLHFTAFFLNYAQTPADLPTGTPVTGGRG